MTLSTRVLVLPDPGPAITKSGASVVSTTRSCSALHLTTTGLPYTKFRKRGVLLPSRTETIWRTPDKKRREVVKNVYRVPRLAKAFVVNKRKRPTPQLGREQFALFSLHEILAISERRLEQILNLKRAQSFNPKGMLCLYEYIKILHQKSKRKPRTASFCLFMVLCGES